MHFFRLKIHQPNEFLLNFDSMRLFYSIESVKYFNTMLHKTTKTTLDNFAFRN